MSFFFTKPLYEPKPDAGILGAGVQSGTSQDGLDICLCRFEYNTESPLKPAMTLLEGTTVPFPDKLSHRLRHSSFKKNADLEEILLLGRELAEFTSESLLEKLSDWYVSREELGFIASHGQTLYHNRVEHPHPVVCTYQATDADLLCELTGSVVVSDFRTRHIASGGEGAPLAPLYDYAYYHHSSKTRVMLNIGGISNISIIRPGSALHEVTYGDTGPGNKIMDQFAQYIDSRRHYDEKGTIAASGKTDEHLLELLLDNPYFKRALPKSTGPELFNLDWVMRVIEKSGMEQPSNPNLMATLAELTASSIADCLMIQLKKGEEAEIIVSGGGTRNNHLMMQLKEKIKQPVKSLDEVGGSSQFKEAQLFAYLGYCTLFTEGLPVFAPEKNIRLGKISLPSEDPKPGVF
ncbi:MAG: anhydro-N-acetylmuramic acid kinase [Balneolia bacterium]|nr:anhydro-N-acetylmuramic acid kinase [Balneolia bacterium]